MNSQALSGASVRRRGEPSIQGPQGTASAQGDQQRPNGLLQPRRENQRARRRPLREAQQPDPQQAPRSSWIPNPVDWWSDMMDRWRGELETPVWTRENEYSSDSAIAPRRLQGLSRRTTELESSRTNIHVSGLKPFESGQGPGKPAGTNTEHHDSFTQAVAYAGIQRLREIYDQSKLGMSFEDVVGAKSDKSHMRAFVNSVEEVNAFYLPADEEIHFGTSEGKWDLGADQDVVLHEAGHWLLDKLAPNLTQRTVTPSALHEGYGDALAALVFRDPELSEDFGKVEGERGDELRSSEHAKTAIDTPTSPHKRGSVYAALLWELGEHIQGQLGDARPQGKDEATMTDEAANEALKIVFTFPTLLATRDPSPRDVVNAIGAAIDDLAKGKKFDSRVDVAKLKAFLAEEVARRELLWQDPPLNSPRADINANSEQAAISRALQIAGFDPEDTRVQQVHDTLKTPSGEQISRYELQIAIRIGRQTQWVAVNDDYLTLVKQTDGKYDVHVGLLSGASGQELEGPQIALRTPDPGEQLTLPAFAMERVSNALMAHVRSDLESIEPTQENALDDARGLRPGSTSAASSSCCSCGVTGCGGGHSHGHTHTKEVTPALLAMAAQRVDTAKPRLIWENGHLKAEIQLGPIKYVGTVSTRGELMTPSIDRQVHAFIN